MLKPSSPQDEIEMSPTTNVEDHDISSPDAPLIARATTRSAISESGDPPIQYAPSDAASQGSLFLWTLTLAACVSGLLFGYDTGVISSTLVSVGSDLSARQLTTTDKALITSSTSLFAFIASPLAGVLADRWGRKAVILIADVLFVAGALGQACVGTVVGMVVGRGVVGLAIGGASLVVPLYISEVAPGGQRGRLVTVSLLFITSGQMVAYLVGWALSATTGGWRWMVGLGALPAVVQFGMLLFMAETPRWLLKAGREKRARSVLEKIYGQGHGTGIVDHTVQAIKSEIAEEERATQSHPSRSSIFPPTLRSLVFHPPHARALTIACLLQGLQQLCGFNSLMYFSATIFSSLGFSSPTLTALSIATTNFIFTVLAFNLIDRVGRRKILLYTIPGMSVALILCAVFFRSVDTNSSVGQKALSFSQSKNLPRFSAMGILISLIIYVGFYATGLGPVPWQQSELFPLSVRSLGSSISTGTNWMCNFLIGLSFLPMMEILTPFWTFMTYAAICALGWAAVWWIYPETMGMDLERVGELLKNGWGVRESIENAKRRGDLDPNS